MNLKGRISDLLDDEQNAHTNISKRHIFMMKFESKFKTELSNLLYPTNEKKVISLIESVLKEVLIEKWLENFW